MEFKRQFEGFCTVYEDVDMLIDDDIEGLKKIEMYIRSCRPVQYKVQREGGYIRIIITAPFCMCG
jgi:hypothetical protein